jgi:hypothetical protein
MASNMRNPRTSDTLRVLDPSDIDQLPWQSVPGCPGVRVSELWRRGDDHDALIAFEPGARTPGPPHRQAQHHIWVISGYASVAGRRITSGSYVYVPPGLAHAVEGIGPDGCTLLQVHRSLAQ